MATTPAEAFIADIHSKPIYVGFFHGEFDACPAKTVYRDKFSFMFQHMNAPPDPATQSTMTVPPNVSLMQLTKPGEYLMLNSSILYYFFHKKQFYTQTLMPLFAVRSPKDIVHHKDAEYLCWDFEKRKGHAANKISGVGKTLAAALTAPTNPINAEASQKAAKEAMQLMKDVTERKKYEAGDPTHFSEISRFMGGDEVPNLILSQVDKHMVGLGVYKYSPNTGKIEKILVDTIPGIPRGGDLRLYHLTNYISRVGGGRMILFSCNSLATAKLQTQQGIAKALTARQTIARLQENYIARNPVMSPERDWALFEAAFPKVFMPNLQFVNPFSLKALDNNYKHWILYNLITYGEFYESMPEVTMTLTSSLRHGALQNNAPHGVYIQNLGQPLGNKAPAPGEGVTSYLCRRGKKSCAIQGGTRKHRKGVRKTRRH